MFRIVRFVFIGHLHQAWVAAFLFLAGGLLSLPVASCRLERLTWLAQVLLRMIRRLVGTRPTTARLWAVIFGFNGTAMFLYMATGIHPILPAAISLLTGYHIGIILFKAGQTEGWEVFPGACSPGWMPGRRVAGICGVAVLLLELPCFWYSIAMGIRMGQEITLGRATYLQGLAPRLEAYGLVLLPLLLLSGLCEAIAIRGLQSGLPEKAGLSRDEDRPRGAGG